MTGPAIGIKGLGARVHLFVQPAEREALAALFREVLGCNVIERDFGLDHPILLVSFEDGSAFSVEFTDRAPAAHAPNAVDDEHAFRGAWLEFRTADPAGVQAALRSAGIAEFRHRGSNHAYFSAPGGQVFRVLDVTYSGP